jgi:agmatinase
MSSYSSFLASEVPQLDPDACLFHVLPAPMEDTVSYGGGTANGPRAILEASAQLEAYDGVDCPCEHGIHTHATLHTLEQIEAAVGRCMEQDRVPVLLGGEHTVSLGAFRALASLSEPVGIVQLDAHADLRESYEGSPLSHACVMRRALELGLPIAQFGVRALSPEEVALREQRGIFFQDGYDIGVNGLREELLPPDFPETVYVTIDIDALDPSLMPATGTPEPGGLDWWSATALLGRISSERRVIGFDCVELAPIPGMHAPDFTTARLIYNFMGMIARSVRG